MLKANTFGYRGKMSLADKEDLESLAGRSVRPPPPQQPALPHPPLTDTR